MVLTPTKGKWVHPHESLLDSEVSYFVKLVGVIAVGEPRGSDVVKAALQKMKFSRHIKRSEGTKPPKVQLSISVKGVRLTDVKASQVLYDIKLNHVSFCTDDKEDKRMFSFIARRDDAQHYCYGLESSQANDITLTIGQAFELAYDKFLKSEKGMATSKQDSAVMRDRKHFVIELAYRYPYKVVDLNKRIQELESENAKLKNHIVSLEGGKPVPTSSATSASQSEFDAVKARTEAKDAFDMQPFCGSAKISPPAVVRLPSPDQVHPTKVSRRRTTSIQQDLGRQLFDDPLNEISKLDLCKVEDGFSKGLNMNESDISLDAFDPLKN